VVSSVSWGGDGSVLYITASIAIYRIRLSTKGATTNTTEDSHA
jgi:hypothetical protein